MSRLNEQSGGGVWAFEAPEPERHSDSRRPAGQLFLSVLSMLFASAVGISVLLATSAGLFCTEIRRVSGANIATGGKIALFASLVAIVVGVVVRNEARLLSSVLVLEALALGTSMGFIARDSAVAKQTEDCGFLFESDVSTSTHHVQYAYVVLGLAIVVLLAQAFRGLGGRPRRVGGAVAGVASAALLAALVPGHGSAKTERSAASRPPKGVLVCRAFIAPEALGGPQCEQDVDIGRAPIRRPDGLECSTYLGDVRHKMIGIQVFYEGHLIKHANLRSSDSATSPYAYFDGSDIAGIATAPRLPIGRYRCRFLVNGTIVRDRTFTVERLVRRGRPSVTL